jgi:hypothetical protein
MTPRVFPDPEEDDRLHLVVHLLPHDVGQSGNPVEKGPQGRHRDVAFVDCVDPGATDGLGVQQAQPRDRLQRFLDRPQAVVV